MSLVHSDSVNHFNVHDQLYHVIPTISGSICEVIGSLDMTLIPILCPVSAVNFDKTLFLQYEEYYFP